ncbi:MAG: hypothetical protein R2717_05585 [Schumannella sp.]
MRPRVVLAASAAALLLPMLTACDPGGDDSPPANPPGQSGGDEVPPPTSAWDEALTETDVLGFHALATASNGAVLDIRMIVHAPEPFSADGAADAWARTTDWCQGEVDDQVIADWGYSFTTVDVTAQTVSGQWPMDTPILLLPLPFEDSTIVTAGDAIVQTNEPAQFGQVAGQVPHCAQPALLIKAGTGSIYVGIPGDLDGDANGTPPFGGWANRKYGVNANQPGDNPASPVTFSQCEYTVTQLGTELGAPTASWQEDFQSAFCAVGGDSVGVDAG